MQGALYVSIHACFDNSKQLLQPVRVMKDFWCLLAGYSSYISVCVDLL
jgi:hypothetical protein